MANITKEEYNLDKDKDIEYISFLNIGLQNISLNSIEIKSNTIYIYDGINNSIDYLCNMIHDSNYEDKLDQYIEHCKKKKRKNSKRFIYIKKRKI